ncbi:transferase [Proteus sp. G2667]|uniref:acetyltransferase n=1 Tax=Proteus sp. G2667 TaxID=2698880 RepID=UPI001376A3CD|nr:acetyltransferase [Proteus sp. G2667]NBM57127.1 transferase [Proteus sp. G2667]
MYKEPIYVIGSSGHASVVCELIESLKEFYIDGIIDDFKNKGEYFLNYKIVGDISYVNELSARKKINIAIGIGESKNRKKVVDKLENKENIIFPILIHPTAIISKRASLLEGSVILANTIIGPNSTIGKHCLINHACSLDHNSKLGNYVTLCPNVFIAGNTNIDSYTIIGLGSNIIEKIAIGKNVFIGAGSCVISNIYDNVLCYGVPAKVISKLGAKDVFFK